MTDLLSPLFGILNWIICLVETFFYMVADGIIWSINMVIKGLSIIVIALLLVLPDMPSLPSLPTAFVTAEGWVAWFWPVSTTVDIFAFIFTAWLIWLGVSIGLRWAKALNT